MSKNGSRFLRVILVAGLCTALLPAAVASAGSFKNGNGSLTINPKVVKKLKKKGVKIGKSVSFSYSNNSSPFLQINMTNGLAAELPLGGKLKIKAGKAKAVLTNFRITGTTLTASLNNKRLTFPVHGGTTTSPAAPHAVSVSVSGVNVKLTKADAKAINKQLSKNGNTVTAVKPGKFGTLSYNGQDRQLLEVAGAGAGNQATLCSGASAAKDHSNDIRANPVSPATVQLACGPPLYGASYPALSSGVVDATTGNGHIDVGGGVETTCHADSDIAGGGNNNGTQDCHNPGDKVDFGQVQFNLNGPTASTVSAVLPVVGRKDVLTVGLTSQPVINAGKDSGSFTTGTPATLKFEPFTAGSLNATFNPTNPYCPSATCTTPDTYGQAQLTVQFK